MDPHIKLPSNAGTEPNDPACPRYTHASCLLTRQKILDAAKKVFTRDGFQGATTREIAREAGVNEVTLFRHFQTRDHLLREAILDGMIDVEELVGPEEVWKQDFPAEMERFVGRYYARLLERETLVRAIVGEGGRLSPAVRQVMMEKKILPIRDALIQRFHAARESGCIRSDIDVGATTDSLRDCLHAGMLRRTMYGDGGCGLETYLHVVTAIFLNGIQ
ncbi:MAG: TetR/AcrR family transcriptional regulator [Chthoniobacteraceae bacterium]